MSIIIVAVVAVVLIAILSEVLLRVKHSRECRGPQTINFDGVYMSERSDIGAYDYLRFYPDRTVINGLSTGLPSDIRSWFNKDRNDVSTGKFTQQDRTIWFSTISSTVFTVWEGEIEGSWIRCHGYSHTTGYHFTKLYKFNNW